MTPGNQKTIREGSGWFVILLASQVFCISGHPDVEQRIVEDGSTGSPRGPFFPTFFGGPSDSGS